MAVYRITTEIPALKQTATPPVRRIELRMALSLHLAMKLTLILVAAFAAAVTLLRVLSYSSSDLHAIITPPENCAMPCWNGIQPGVTTVDEAVQILQADPTVSDYQVTPGKLSWWWNGDQPAAFDTSGRAFHGRMEYATVNGADRITSIVLDTTIPLGNVQLTLGSPDAITLHTIQPQDASQRAGIVYVAHYDALSVFTVLDCPMNVDDFWGSQAYVTFGTPALIFEGETFEVNSLPDWFFRDQALGCAAR
jgi:hypothetical protein